MAKNDFRVTSIFKLIIRICMENVEFCGKTFKFLPKRCLCLFIFCIFYVNEQELNQQVWLIKYTEIEISNSTSHKKREREGEEQKQFQNIQFQKFNSKTPENLSLVRPWENFEKQKLVLNFKSCYCYFK